MSQTQSLWWSVVVGWALWLGCANQELSRPEGQRLTNMPAHLTVTNSMQTAMQIYWRPDLGGEIYLGRIVLGETKTFYLRPPWPPGRSFLMAMQALPAGANQPVIAELAEAITGGDTLHWDLRLNQLDWRANTATR